LGNLIKVRGVVTRRSGVFPQLSLVKWDCGRCGTTMGPFVVADNAEEVKPKQCVACQAKGGFTVGDAVVRLVQCPLTSLETGTKEPPPIVGARSGFLNRLHSSPA
jgi:DNA replicative helicase MCM subunit Mcm2 (Cdc46/Mcm family)